jgi:hypothetical protein
MATNRALREALLELLKVTRQRLWQRAKRMKDEHGPMSTEDATYVIAHQEGIDLTKYLDQSTVDRIRGLIPEGPHKSASGSRNKSRDSGRRPVVVRIGPDVPQVDALLSTTQAQDARKMAQVYPKYYVLENSVRALIMRVLGMAYGKQWWDTRAPKAVRDTVAERMKKEARQPWHGKRGQHEIFYSDFGDLKRIISKNWGDFEAFFPSQEWILQRLCDMEHPRNVMAHHNPLGPQDLTRVDLCFSDWIALLKLKRDLIPP